MPNQDPSPLCLLPQSHGIDDSGFAVAAASSSPIALSAVRALLPPLELVSAGSVAAASETWQTCTAAILALRPRRTMVSARVAAAEDGAAARTASEETYEGACKAGLPA
eukprot:366091-Chlamydomonas_euryale.AAC.9